MSFLEGKINCDRLLTQTEKKEALKISFLRGEKIKVSNSDTADFLTRTEKNNRTQKCPF